MAIKIGNLDISSFKVGGNDCSIYLGYTKLYPQSQPPHDYSQDYLTVSALGSGNVSWSGTSTSNTLSYSTDNGATWSSPSIEITVPVNSGDTVLFKGECTPLTSSPYGIGRFSGTTADFDVEGNIMSLLYGDNFKGQTNLSGKYYTFRELFRNCTTLQSAENLSLLATTLEMDCYENMFQSCTSLTTAPELPATTLADSCYQSMFYNCSQLSSITCLATDISASECTLYLAYHVAATGTFTTPSSTNWTTGASGIPYGWTRVDYNE